MEELVWPAEDNLWVFFLRCDYLFDLLFCRPAAMVADAVARYFEAEQRAQRVGLQFVQDPVLALP